MCKQGEVVHLKNAIYTPKGYEDVMVDKCLFSFLEKLNKKGIATEFSCCGHGTGIPYMTVLLRSERVLDKLLVDIKSTLKWKNLRGFGFPMNSDRETGTFRPNFDLQNLKFVSVYAFEGFEDQKERYPFMMSYE